MLYSRLLEFDFFPRNIIKHSPNSWLFLSLLFPVGNVTWILKSGSQEGSVVELSRANCISFFILFCFSFSSMSSLLRYSWTWSALVNGPPHSWRHWRRSSLFLSFACATCCFSLAPFVNFSLVFSSHSSLISSFLCRDGNRNFWIDEQNLSKIRAMYQLSNKLRFPKILLPSLLLWNSSLKDLNLETSSPLNSAAFAKIMDLLTDSRVLSFFNLRILFELIF